MVWTARDVEKRLREAALVLLLMPDPHRRHLLGRPQATWPVCANEAAFAYGYAGDPGLVGKDGRRVPVTVRDPEDRALTKEVMVAIPKDKATTSARAIAAQKLADLGVDIDYMPAAIDRMDQALPWLGWLSPEREEFVWRRLTGTTWPSIAAIEHRTERTCRRWFVDAMEQIADELITLERT